MPRKPNWKFIFPSGTPVEVRSNKPEFAGAWFPAIIKIAHTNRFSHYRISSPAFFKEEVVPAHAVRPQPPPPAEGTCYDLHSHVDAFYDDGWWAGVVTGLPGEGRDWYLVCFPGKREEFEFTASEIRKHVEWTEKGGWVSAQDQGVKNVMFPVGTKVEVSRSNKLNHAVWFVGSVLKVLGKTDFLVEFENGHTCTREIVDLAFIRPSPEMKIQNFKVQEQVEVYCGGAWYAAKIVEILPGPKYVVIADSGEKMELDSNSIRSRYIWTHGHRSSTIKSKQVNSGIGLQTRSAKRTKKSNGDNILPVSSTPREEICEDTDLSNFFGSKQKGAKVESPGTPKKLECEVLLKECNSEEDPPSEKSTLPFTKKSKLWGLIESRTAFQLSPQQPHFCKLEEVDEDLCEGAALGLMFTYSKLVDETRKRNVVFPPDEIENKLDVLKTLESNGFNVEFCKTHFQNLLKISKKIANAEKEKEKLKNLVSSLDKELSNMEARLNVKRAERASIVSKMTNIDSEVLLLQIAARAVNEELVSVEQQNNMSQADAM